MKRSALLLLTVMCAFNNIRAQGDADGSNDMILRNTTVPAPSVAPIAQVADVPVSLYTGTPNISIPLYTIQSGKISWPVTLSYGASGIRVGENAGNVGLGWSIAAEGAVIQSVQGRKDNGSYQSDGLSWNSEILLPNTAANFTLLQNLSSGVQDGVPDFYLYNFNGNSGKFMMAGGLKLLPQKNLDIAPFSEGSQNGWRIIDESGMIYYFMAQEITQNRAQGSVGTSSSWLLTRVVDPNYIDTLEFEYENTCVLMGIGNSYELTSWQDTSAAGGWTVDMDQGGGGGSIPGNLHQYSQTTTGKQLKRIKFRNGSVEYDIAYNDREDMITTGSSVINVPRVKNLFVKDKAGTVIKTIHFTHDYFVTPSVSGVNGRRLRLQSVIFAPTLNDLYTPQAQQYTFTYNATNLPSKQSNAIDHWGYYNGATTNQGLIPTIHYQGMDYYGANRETVPGYAACGMLEKIQYPTGGHTQFVWENHKVYAGSYPALVDVDSVLKAQAICEGNEGTWFTEESTWVTIPDNDTFNNVSAELFGSVGHPYGANSQSITHAGAKVILYEVSGSTETIKKSLSFAFNPSNDYTKTATVQLERGKTYHFIVTSRGGLGYSIFGQLTIPWPKIRTLGGDLTNVGGARIRQINRYDPVSGKTITKKYFYSNAHVVSWPQYYREVYKYVDPMLETPLGGNIPCDEVRATGIFMSSSSIYNLGTGNHVGYDQVQETVGNGEGSTLYTYSTTTPGNQNSEVVLSWRYGLLKNVRVFDRNMSMLKQTIYKNKVLTLPGQRYTGYTASLSGMHPCADAGNAGNNQYPAYYFTQYYDMPVDWVYTDTVEEYDYTSGIHFRNVSSFDNPQHKQVTRSTVFYPDGSRQTSFFKYPTDFTITGTPVSEATEGIKLLQDKHMHNLPVEQYVQKWLPESTTALTLAASYNEYKPAATAQQIVLPYISYALDLASGIGDFVPAAMSGNAIQTDSRYVVKAIAKEYDRKTNLVTLSAPGGVSVGSIWGYKASVPVALVKNHTANKRIAFTSFEQDASGNWTYAPAGVSTTGHVTGSSCYNLSAGAVYHSTTGNDDMILYPLPVDNTGRYVVSYWKRGGSVLVNNTSPSLTGATANGWTYCEHVLLNPSVVNLTGTAQIDELRLYPQGAAMESYTYDPLTGVTSFDNAASHIILYEYDAMGRLVIERDVFGNILKKHSYGYQVAE